ncbi:MAG: DNA-processing protein DprA [Coriobacteriia bacterium]|nr:DNA-processing protein DprA [Coriobacteriia bacterium]
MDVQELGERPVLGSSVAPQGATMSKARAKRSHQRKGFTPYTGPKLRGTRYRLELGSALYPEYLAAIPRPPKELYVIGNPEALQPGLAVVGARKATPYGLGCAKRFATLAARKGICIISGGARGCDAQAHRAALEEGAPTVAFLGGGCDELYPAEHYELFQQIVDSGGAVASEHPWDFPPLPYTFRERNRLIAGLARATLIVEAGLPSGTFSTADEATQASREVLAVPGSILSPASKGTNYLLSEGAHMVYDDVSFEETLLTLYGALMSPGTADQAEALEEDPLLAAVLATPCHRDELLEIARGMGVGSAQVHAWLALRLAELEASGRIAKYPDGRYGPAGR